MTRFRPYINNLIIEEFFYKGELFFTRQIRLKIENTLSFISCKKVSKTPWHTLGEMLL